MANYYDNFVATVPNPRDSYLIQQQEIINQLFVNAPTYFTDVEEEKVAGSLIFESIFVRINNLIDAKSGRRVNDDFKKIIFSDIEHAPAIGARFRFEDNIWLTFSTDNIKTSTAAVYVRRCNNTLNSQDKYGNVHQEPCYIDYGVTEAQVFKEYSVNIPRGRIVVFCQLNDYTKNININHRYVFGGDAYRVRYRDRFDKRYTFDKNSVGILYLQLEYDNIAESDNLELDVADYLEYNFSIETLSEFTNIIGTTKQLSASVLLNEENVTDNYPVEWRSTNTNIATVTSDGLLKLEGLGDCDVVCTLKNKDTVYSSVHVSVVEEVHDFVTNNIITPDITYIKQNSSQEYNVYEYINGETTSAPFIIKAYDVPLGYYKLEVANNKFIVFGIKPCDIPLRVVCTNANTNDTVEISIELGGLF